MPQKRDYYEVLDIPKTATKAEIKKAYRKLAMKYHPDVNKGDENSEDKFKEVNEAYENLSDDKKKQIYDRYGHQDQNGGGQQGGFGAGGFEDIFRGQTAGFGSIFEEFFGGGPSNRPQKGQDIVQQVNITLEEAFFGKKINIKMLNGETKEFNIPRGIDNGTELRIQGQGYPSKNKGPNGDYFIRVFVTPVKGIKRTGDDLVYLLDINVLDAMSGKKEEIILFKNEKIKITIPELTDLSKLLRAKGKGFVNIKRPESRGDLYVKLNPVMPKKLSKNSIKLLDLLQKEIKSNH